MPEPWTICLSVGRSVSRVSVRKVYCDETADWIRMLFGTLGCEWGWSRDGCIRWGWLLSKERAVLGMDISALLAILIESDALIIRATTWLLTHRNVRAVHCTY